MIDRWHTRVIENGVVNDPTILMMDEISQLRVIYSLARKMVMSEDQEAFETAYILMNLAVKKYE